MQANGRQEKWTFEIIQNDAIIWSQSYIFQPADHLLNVAMTFIIVYHMIFQAILWW